MNVVVLLAKKLGIYLCAVGVAYCLAVVTASQHVVASLGSMGVEVGPGDRVAMTVADLGGMAGMFLPLIAFGFLVAFLVAALLGRWLGRWRVALYALAGATALASIHLLLHLAFVVFVVLGGLLVLRWPRLAWVHVPAVLWGAIIFLNFRTRYLEMIRKVIYIIIIRFFGIHLTGHARKIKEI